MSVRFSAIGEIISPIHTWNPSSESQDGTFRYIDLSSIDNEAKRVRVVQDIRVEDAPSRARQLVKNGDILVSTVRPNLNGVAKLNGNHDGATASTGFCVLRPDPVVVCPEYLFQWVKSPAFVSDMARKATGASYPAVSHRIIAESLIPLPSLQEQRRIAAILDQADDLRRKRREAFDRLETLAGVLFSELFGDVVRNDRGWKVEPLSSTIENFEGGKNLVAEGDESQNPTRVLKISAIQEDGFYERESKALPDGYVPPARHFVRRNDLLLSRANTTERVGLVARVEHDVENLVLPDKILRFVWKDRSSVSVRYWLHCFRTPAMRRLVGRLATGTSGSMKNISQEKLLLMRLSLPPLDLQRAFAARIAEIDALKAHHRAHLAKLDALFASLQHRAFRGEL